VPTGRFAFCAELNARFLNPVRPDNEIFATGEMLANRKNRIFEAKGVLADASGRIFAEATGKFLPIPKSDLTGMMTDLIGDTSWLREGADSGAR
jgi:acyl-coenzyme A thioesterase PaaI-like protein